MKRALRYNELDELAWETEHGCIDHACEDECWDEVCTREMYEDAPEEEFVPDDETGPGIFGNELNHEQNANASVSSCVSSGRISGHGDPDDILSLIATLLEPAVDCHYTFEFFHVPQFTQSDGVQKQK